MRMTDEFDAVIIGAGPAGAAAARLLALWGHEILLIGRSPNRRTIAESLPPSCVKLFERLGVRADIDRAGFVRATGNTVRWGGGEPRAELFDPIAPGYQVRRDVFDGILVSSARVAGATVVEDANVIGAARGADSWQLTYECHGERTTVSTSRVLDCSGRSGVMARRGLRRPDSALRTTAVIGVWDLEQPADDTHTHVESFDGGWAWSVPVSNSRRYVTVMLDPTATELPGRDQLLTAYRAELARAPMIAALTHDATLVDGPWGCDASPYTSSRFADDGVLLVGDAGSFVDPLSSFGVKKALASAWLASVVVHSISSDSRLVGPATELFEARERQMYENLQRQSAALLRDAADSHVGGFWDSRGEMQGDDIASDLDAGSLRTDPRVLGAFDELRRRQAIRLRMNDSVSFVDRALVRGNRVVLEQHLVAPAMPRGARYCRNVDLYVISQLAGKYEQVPDLFDAYNRTAAPAPLPDFLGALSTLIGLEVLSFA